MVGGGAGVGGATLLVGGNVGAGVVLDRMGGTGTAVGCGAVARGGGAAAGGCGSDGVGSGAGGAGWAAAGGGCTVTVTAGWPFGLAATLTVTAVLMGSGVSSFSTKLSLPAVSWVRPPASCAVTLASIDWPMRRTSASMVARASFTAASAGSAAGSERPVSWASRAATSDMPPPCRESG